MPGASVNAAQRLHDVLQLLNSDHGKNTPVWQVLGLIGGDGDGTPAGSIAVAFAIRNLARQVEAEVREAFLDDPESTELYLEWKPAVDAVIDNLANGHDLIGNVRMRYDASTLLSLRHTANRTRDLSAVPLPDDALAELLTVLRQFRDDVTSATAQEIAGLRLFLLGLIDTMIQAAEQYRISGNEGLEDAIARSVGALIHKFNPAAGPAPTDQQKKWFDKFWDGPVVKTAAVLAMSNSAFELVGNVMLAIAGG